MKLEDEVMDMIAKDIAKEIDEGIISNMLVEIGWTSVKFEFKDSIQANDINFWLLENCKEGWSRYSGSYFFEDVKEAEWFILRWV